MRFVFVNAFLILIFKLQIFNLVQAGTKSMFKSHDIVGIDHIDCSLYGEIIQLVESRNCSWIRPLALVIHADSSLDCQLQSVNLRQAPDLICPISLLRPALDTEIFPYLNLLVQEYDVVEINPQAHRYLQTFMHKIWLAHRHEF